VTTSRWRLIAKNLYDVKILPQLESYVKLQVKENSYDFEANRHLLKLYLFSPGEIKVSILGQILVKALMALPETDFLACLYLIPAHLHQQEPVETLVRLADLLETAQFSKFWKERFSGSPSDPARAVIDGVKGFDDAVRSFITTTVSITYRRIVASQFQSYLNLPEQKTFEQSIKKAGFELAENGATVVLPAREENSIK